MIKITGTRMPKSLQTKGNTSRQVAWKTKEEALVESAIVIRELIKIDPLLATEAVSIAADSVNGNVDIEAAAKARSASRLDAECVIRTPPRQDARRSAIKPQNRSIDDCSGLLRKLWQSYATGTPSEGATA